MPVPQAVKRAPAGPSSAKSPSSAKLPRLITDITVEHGPVDLFGRFFLLADTAARERGVSLSFGTYEELLRVNEKNRATWGVMTSMYDHRCCPEGLSPENAFCIFGRDDNGEVVTTHAGRIYQLGERSLQDFADDMRLFHDDPERTKRPGETVEMTAPSARSIKGTLLINGAVWLHPEYRKRQITMIVPRIARAYAYTHWKIDRSMGLMMEGPAAGGVIDSLGYPYREWGMQLRNAQNGSPRVCLAWMEANELIADLRGFLAGFTTQVYVRVDHRRAQNQR